MSAARPLLHVTLHATRHHPLPPFEGFRDARPRCEPEVSDTQRYVHGPQPVAFGEASIAEGVEAMDSVLAIDNDKVVAQGRILGKGIK